MAKRKRHWSKMLEEAGVAIRIYKRANSSSIWYSVMKGSEKIRKTLKTTDRQLAELRAKAIACEMAKITLDGGVPNEVLTLGRLAALYLHHRGPLLKPARKKHMELVLGLLRRHLGDDFRVEDFGQHDVDAYVAARTSGQLLPEDRRASSRPRAGTIRNELESFSVICNWAVGLRRGGRRTLDFNPLHSAPGKRGLTLPDEANRIRPIASKDRYRALLAQADRADPEGRLRTLLILAWETGRRINAILHLRAADVLFGKEQVKRVLAEEGMDEASAEGWSDALRWRAEWDKVGYLDVSPINPAARAALEAYLRKHPKVGEAWVFPANGDGSKALHKQMAGYYLIRAEKLAGLTKMKRGGWHAFRRSWAQRRKSMPVQDVMKAGGWRDVKALQRAYQTADPRTTLLVVEAS